MTPPRFYRAFKAIIIGVLFTMLAPLPFSAQEAPPPAKVRLETVTEATHAANSGLVGVLYYDRVSNISSEVAGQVRQADWRTGDQIKKGAPLVRIGTDFFDQDISIEKARIEAIDVKIENVAKDVARYRSLLAKKAVSESAYDALYFNHQTLLKERETIRAGLAKIRLKRSKCVIRAPFFWRHHFGKIGGYGRLGGSRSQTIPYRSDCRPVCESACFGAIGTLQRTRHTG